MKRFLALIISVVFSASICSAAEFRKWGMEDIEWGWGTWTSAGGVVSTKVNATAIPGLPVVSVVAFNATGNGTTDDTEAIRSAIDNVTTTGGTVYFPAGTYKVTDGIYVRGSVNLVGDGSTSRIIQTGTSFPTTTVLFYYQSPTATTFTSTGTLSAGDTTMTLNSTAGLVTGQEVFLQLGTATYDATQPYLCMFNTIASISGSDVTFRIPISEDVSGTSHNVLSLTRIVQGVTVANLSIEADSAATPDQAMYIERCRNVGVYNITMNHTGALINAQSENVSYENIYVKRARRYGTPEYAASGNAIGGWGFRNYNIKNVFIEDADANGIYLEAEGRGASIENFVYNVGPGHTASGYGMWIGGHCKGIYLKNGHFNAPYTNYFGPYISEQSDVRTEDVFLYNGIIGYGFLKYHRGLLGWDGATGAMTYYEKIKQYTIKITMDNSTYTAYTLPSGIYKQVRAYTDDAPQVTELHFQFDTSDAAELHASLQTDNTVDLSTYDLVSLGPDAAYPFNNHMSKRMVVRTGSAASGKVLIVNIEYYAIDNDANHGMIQDTY